MTIAKDCIVSFDYTLKDEGGVIIDTTEGSEPLEYIHGREDLIVGLERALEGKQAGDELKDIVIPPQDAYGEHLPALAAEVDRSNFPSDAEIEVGMQFEAEGHGGVQVVTVTKVSGDKITVDGNHPLAGKTLHFDVKILAVREATEEEKARGLDHGCCCGGHDDSVDDCCCGGHDDLSGGCCCGHGHGHCGR